MKNRSNLIILVMLVSLCISMISGCSSPQNVASVTLTSNQPTVVPSATPEPPTELPPTMTLSPTPEVIELNPSPRGYVSMAYDSESGQIILFGGQTEAIGNTSNETWAYDVSANEWTNMNPSDAPPPGSAGSLVYDVESDRIILYGVTGRTTPSRDTWAYDFNSNTWTKMSAQGPSNHLGSQMVYDVESDRVILFAGYFVGRNEYLNDTRVYDFNTDTWIKMEADPAPPGRNFHCMAYDTKADQAIAFGGDVIGDTSIWAYDFNADTWEENVTNNGPASRPYCGMVYSTEADKVFIYGGHPEGSSEMWMYDHNLNTWTELKPDINPGKLSRFAIAYVPDLDEIVLFGGQLGDEQFNYTQSTWVYDVKTNTWTETTRYP